jgi:hypothetical protein
MPFVNISQVYAADPGAIWTPKRSFVSTDPFAIVIRAQVSQDVIDAGLRFDAYFQADNPRRDPWQGNWWAWLDGGRPSEASPETTAGLMFRFNGVRTLRSMFGGVSTATSLATYGGLTA